MKNIFDLQLFADGEGEGASKAGTSEAEAAENSAAAPEKAEEAKTEKTADADEISVQNTEKKESPSKDGSESKGEEVSLPQKGDDRLLQSLQTALSEKLKNEEVKRIIDDWEKSGEELKEIYPGFELKKELKSNEDFRRLLKAGVSVRRAYETANLEKILGSALRYAAVTAGKKTADSVRSHRGRVQENSVLDKASSLSRRDVNSLTKKDILKIIDEVSRGATIKF